MTADSRPGTPLAPRLRARVLAIRRGLTRNRLRVALAVLVLLSAGVLVASATGDDLSTASKAEAPEAPPTENVTVITESGRAGTIIAYNPDGNILYYENERTKYFDVDPVPGEPNTVEYVATDTIHSTGPTCSDPPCARNVLERVDLETGEMEVLFERYNHQETAGEWHDHVRVNETHVLIADILYDRIYLVDLDTGIITWEWEAQSDFDVATTGGAFPRDWTHLNDVSLLEDGRVMASLRNHDRVVFIDPGTGVQENWTLGNEDDYDVLYEQHNPDYIPAERGGPAVVVADSENGNVEEYQRVDGEWEQSWTWSDGQMQWPRDADRLPDGNTLIVDSHGKRVLEVDQDGEIVWEVPSTMPYDAERLGTGAESAGGQSATDLDLTSSTPGNGASVDSSGVAPLVWLGQFVKGLLPHRVVNAIYFVAPVWFGNAEFAALGFGVLAALLWGGLEARWWAHDAGIRVRVPVYRERE